MALVEIDDVGLKPLERRIELLFDLRPRQAEIGVRHGKIELGREHVAVARPALQRLTEEGFCGSAAVDVRRVDEVDADVERRIEAGSCLLRLDSDAIGKP
jgi:hypothetical protein